MGAFLLLVNLSASAQAAAPPPVRFTVTGFVVKGENPLSAQETHRILAPYRGVHSGLGGLVAAADALEQAIRAKGYAFHRVLLPAQTLSAGVVTLRVVAFKVGKVTVTGNRYFSKKNILRSLPALQSGRVPDAERLSRELTLANQAPAKKASLSFKQGEQRDAIDADIKVRDQKPWMVFMSFNNTGSAQTGQTRLSAGGQYSNLFDMDQVITATYTTSPGHWSDVKQYGANYHAPIYPLDGAVDMYYVHSDVNSGVLQNIEAVTGSGDFFGLRYTQTLTKIGSYAHSISLSLDNREFDSNAQFLGPLSPFGTTQTRVRTTPVSLRYAGRYQSPRWQGDFYLDYERNIPYGSNSGSANFAAAAGGRSQASQRWDAVRTHGSFVYPLLSGWALHGVVEGQYAGEALVAGEQFGLGGADSVRGLGEREVSGDDGVRGTAEIWTPALPHKLRMLGFVDAGRVWLHHAALGQQTVQSVASLGVGMRWQWRENVGLQVDLGRVLSGTAASPGGTYKAHFNLFARY